MVKTESLLHLHLISLWEVSFEMNISAFVCVCAESTISTVELPLVDANVIENLHG